MASACIEVLVKLPTGKAVSTRHFPNDALRKVSEFVASGEGVPESRVRLKYQGKTLDKSKTIGYLGVRSETILKGEIIFPKDLNLYIQYPDGSCEPLLVQNTDTVSALKTKIQQAKGIPSSQQLLKKESSTGVTLSPAESLLADIGLTDECVIVVTKTEPAKTPAGDSNDIVDEQEVDEEQKMALLGTFATRGRRVEVVFCFDTTGSMYQCLGLVRQKLRQTCERLLRDIPNIRIGIMANGDYCDYEKYIVRWTELTSDVDTVVDFVNNVPSTGGGGNGGECYEWALRKAQQLDWSEESAKALVMIGDELPHKPAYTDLNLFWKDEADVLAGMGVKIYAVQALDSDQSTPFYQELAERTDGYYLRLRNFNLITDMFLAVCYREAEPGQLDDFMEEVERDGRMTEDTRQMMQALEEKPKPVQDLSPTVAAQNARYVASAWWDPSLESADARPEYIYDQELDSFRRYTTPSPAPLSSMSYRATPLSTTSHTRKSKLQRFFCFA